jgi:hypothetical protein
VTISLIIVQQTASFNSIRLVKDSLTNLDFIIVSLIYMFTILYEAWVLRQISQEMSSSIEFHIWVTYFCFAFSLFSLAPYIYNTLELLIPSKLIVKIADSINKKSMEKYTDSIIAEMSTIVSQQCEKQVYLAEENPFKPLFDIVKVSLSHNDYETAKYGIKVIGKRLCILEQTKEFSLLDPYSKGTIIRDLTRYLKYIAKLTSDETESDCLSEIITSVNEIAKVSIKEFMYNETKLAISDIAFLGHRAIENKDELAILSSLIILKDYKKNLTGIKELDDLISDSLKSINDDALEKGLEYGINAVGAIEELRKEYNIN